MSNRASAAFLTINERTGSHGMRSATISRGLRARGHSATSLVIRSKWSLLSVIRTFRFRNIIFVKWFNVPFAGLLKRLGKRIIFDCVDNFEFDTHPPYVRGKEFVDLFIANNARHREFLMDKLRLEPNRVVIIEHYHSNVRRMSKPWTGLETVGYLGQKYYCSLSNGFFEKLTKRGLTFYWGDTNVLTDEAAVEEASKIDCFVAYFEPTAVEDEERTVARQVLQFKPATKVLLPFSLGIPAIFSPYYSYLAAIEQAGFSVSDFLIANNEDDVLRHLDRLQGTMNALEVKVLVQRQQQVAENFSLERILEKYERALGD